MSGVKAAPEALAAEARTMREAGAYWEGASYVAKHNTMEWNTLGVLGLGIPELFNKSMEIYAERVADGAKASQSMGDGFAESGKLYSEKDEEYYQKLGYTGEF